MMFECGVLGQTRHKNLVLQNLVHHILKQSNALSRTFFMSEVAQHGPEYLS